jgi:hypothetical protein
MSAKPDSQTPAGKTKKFGKGERHVPHPSVKAQRFYPAEDETTPRTVRVPVCSDVYEDMPCLNAVDFYCSPRRRLETDPRRRDRPCQHAQLPEVECGHDAN